MTIPRQVLLAMVADAHDTWVLGHDAGTPVRPQRYVPDTDDRHNAVTHNAVAGEGSAQQLRDLHRRIEAAKAGWLSTDP